MAGPMSNWWTKLNSRRLAAARRVRDGLHVQWLRTLSTLFTDEHPLVDSAHLESLPLNRTEPVVGTTTDCLTEIDA
jgi:hypothetical protein